MKRIFLLIILATSCFFLARATDYYVDATTGSNTTGDGSSGNPWQTITYALSQITGTGHTLNVAAGTYDPTLGETFPILMKNGVSLVGAGINISIIDANSTNTVIRCVGIVDSNTRVEGFTINQGKTSGDNNGGGISINAGSILLVTNNLITENEGGDYSGGGVYISNSSPTIENNTISNNIGKYVQRSGSAIYVTGSSSAGLITDNTISGNNNTSGGGGVGGGTIVFDGSSETIIQGNKVLDNNTFVLGSDLGVITVYDCSPIIRSNVIAKSNLNGIKLTNTSSSPSPTIVNNTISDHSEDGIYVGVASPDSIFNNIISLNSGYGIRETGSTSDPGKVWYNLFYNNGLGLYNDEGTTDYYTANSMNTGVAECANNIDGDPMFVDRANDDYHLQLSSPAIDAGDPDPQFNDPDGSRNDIGALAFDSPPAAPQNLSATASAGEITLRWNPNIESDLDQYNIYRDLSSPAITLINSVISTSPPDTFFIDAGLVIGQDYFYRITALDAARNKSDFSGEVNASIPFDLYTDSLALVALYNSTNGANWTNNSNWLTGNVATWYGIIVSADRITEINLADNNLTGIIPIEIGNFTNLIRLYISENQISGSIPSEIGNLLNLNSLSFANNQLSGTIPITIDNLVNLGDLQLNNNQLTGSIPTEIGNLINLTAILLCNNQFTDAIPTEIGYLVNLSHLILDGNQLTGPIPTEIGNLTNLGNLNLCSNQLSGSIPPEIGNLTNLDNLCFGSNQLSGSIPPEIGNLINLTYLNLACNQLSGSIPSEIGNLSSLEHLELYSNQLSGAVPNEISNLTNLQMLYIHNNNFTVLPDLSSLSSLLCLEIRDNKFTFKDIEPNIGITGFVYSPQDSVGEIIDTTVYIGTSYTMSVSTGGANSQYQWKKDETNIGSVSGDSTYTINPVAFSDSGAYTCEITNTVATDLTLYSRPVHVSVEYPPIYQDSLALVALYDSTDGVNWTNNTNWLTGPVSTWYGIVVSYDRVTEIILDNNNLIGTIPSEIGNLTNLYGQLVLCYNQLSGSIPPEIGNLINLGHLDIENNQLTGEIPPEIGNLINLHGLYLSGNQLSGSIPIQIGNLTNLTYLSFGGNNLTGSIPTEIGNLTNLNTLYLGDNHQLFGVIPSEIGNLTNLQYLDLSFNQLSGVVPNSFTNLTKLEKLEFPFNQLTDLPDLSPCNLLYELQINNNRFTFKDIESNIGVASTTFTYSPQDSVGQIIDTTVYTGTSFTLSVSTGGTNSQYQWKKDGTNIGSISSDSTYTINSVALSDSGAYTCEITNTIATDLTLYSRPVNISVPSTLSSEKNILTYSFSEQTGAATIDAVNHTVDIEVAYSTNLANLVATFSISSQASIAINSINQISGVSANNFTNSVTYTVTAENGTTQDWVVTVSEAGITIITDFPYSEDFESGSGGWRTGGANSSWQLGNPAGSTINSATSGSNTWVTNLTGDYNPDEVSYVTSPQFDLSSLNFPKIEFSMWWHAEGFYDGANLQYKLGSDAWKTLGKEESDDSWYNSSYLYSIENGFGFDLNESAGWSGDDEWGYGSNGWVTVDHALTGFDYQSANVTFRIGFASNSGYENDGVAIDDINIFSDPTGIDPAETGLSDIQIYPNPNEGTFTLVYNGERNVDLNLQLVNLHGQVILSEQIETGYRFSKEFELDYLPPGIYYFRLIHKEGVVVKKMVVR